MTRAHLVGYLRENYVPANTLIVAAGRLKHRQVVRAVGALCARAFRAPPARIHARRAASSGHRRLRLFTKRPSKRKSRSASAPARAMDQRRYALRLLNTILGENMSSRLFQVVREDRGLAYSIYSTPSFFDDAGDLVISAGLDTDNLTEDAPAHPARAAPHAGSRPERRRIAPRAGLCHRPD